MDELDVEWIDPVVKDPEAIYGHLEEAGYRF